MSFFETLNKFLSILKPSLNLLTLLKLQCHGSVFQLKYKLEVKQKVSTSEIRFALRIMSEAQWLF